MLKRANEDIVEPLDLASEEMEGLEEVAERLEQGEEVSLDSIPKSLRDAFLRDVANGEMKSMVPVWTPWWFMPESVHNDMMDKELKPMVVEMDSESPEYETESACFPCIRRFLAEKTYSNVTLPAVVSPTVPYNAVEVAFFYCLLSRVYNGEYADCRGEIVEGVLQLSSVLSHAACYESMAEVVVRWCVE
mgnify:FL=1